MVKKVTKKALNEADFSHDEEYDNPENYESNLKLKKLIAYPSDDKLRELEWQTNVSDIGYDKFLSVFLSIKKKLST